jgi:ElaB/YqjD/DUF883 family membrane-anchored ribosome-binding protein
MSMTSSMKDTTSQAKSTSDKAMDNASAAFEKGSEKVNEVVQATKDGAQAQVEKMEILIRQNPMAATGIAAGIGFVVALLARRS